jgi:hypothetical protein
VSVDQASTQLLQKVLEEPSIRFERCAGSVSAGIRLVQEITNSTIGLLLGSALKFPELGQLLNSRARSRARVAQAPPTDLPTRNYLIPK